MGKVRKVIIGDESSEAEQKRRAEARRETKKAKKAKVEGVGLKGGERTSVVEGTDIKPEFKKLVDKTEKGEPTEVKKPEETVRTQVVRQRSHKYLKLRQLVDKNKTYSLSEAVSLIKKTSLTKFVGTVELHININARTLATGKKDVKKDIRGTLTLPHGTGKQVRAVEATDEILSEIETGKLNFDILVARPDMMPKLAKYARVLGPKGLMPNPKNGTVTPDVPKKIKELSAGQVNYKSEPDNPLIHMSVGKANFTDQQLTENINAALDNIGRSRILKATLAATMGPGVKIQI